MRLSSIAFAAVALMTASPTQVSALEPGDCLAGTWYKSATQTCEECDPSCDNTNWGCKGEGAAQCWTACGDGFYNDKLTDPGNLVGTCQPCDASCAAPAAPIDTCKTAGADQCYECPQGKTMDVKGLAQDNVWGACIDRGACPAKKSEMPFMGFQVYWRTLYPIERRLSVSENAVSENAVSEEHRRLQTDVMFCVDCADANCKVCSNRASCDECDATYALQPDAQDQNTCVKITDGCNAGFALGKNEAGKDACKDDCGPGFYKGTNANGKDACIACHESCRSCDGTAATDCLTCVWPLLYTPELKTCDTCDATQGYFAPTDLETTPAPTTEAPAPRRLADERMLANARVCTKDCGVGFYGKVDTATCTACLGECAECTDATTCTVCATDKFLKADATCVDAADCPAGTEANAGVCQIITTTATPTTTVAPTAAPTTDAGVTGVTGAVSSTAAGATAAAGTGKKNALLLRDTSTTYAAYTAKSETARADTETAILAAIAAATEVSVDMFEMTDVQEGSVVYVVGYLGDDASFAGVSSKYETALKDETSDLYKALTTTLSLQPDVTYFTSTEIETDAQGSVVILALQTTAAPTAAPGTGTGTTDASGTTGASGSTDGAAGSTTAVEGTTDADGTTKAGTAGSTTTTADDEEGTGGNNKASGACAVSLFGAAVAVGALLI